MAQTPQQKMMVRNKVREWQRALDELIDAQPDSNYLYRHRNRETASRLTGTSNSGTINTSAVISTPIEQRNTGKGVPGAIIHSGRPLNNRQASLLDQLSSFGSRAVVAKNSVSMKDLAALTAATGDEFAMFTKGSDRLVIRGNEMQTPVDVNDAKQLHSQGYRWSGHTHPGTDTNCLQASDGDMKILEAFEQDMSVIYNSAGRFNQFGR